jgi:hypothetical protein
MDEPPLANLPVPICPRCGYDLRGTAFAWEDACPLEGRCPDCGHEFAWKDLFHRRVHPWLFEHQWRRRRAVLALLVTLAGTLRPNWFWRRVGLEHRVVPSLLAAMVALSLALVLLLTWAGMLSAELWDRLSTHMAQPDFPGYLRDATRATRYAAGRVHQDRLALLLSPLLVPVAMPLLFLTLPAAQVRFVHVLRVTAYSLVGLAMALLALFYADVLLDVLSDLRLLPGSSEEGARQAVRFTAPWSRQFLTRVRGLSTASAAVDFLVLWPLLAWWWRCACKHYLKLPNPAWVAVLLTLLAGLLGLLGQLILTDGWLRYWR